jgi:hypothetical protein
VDRGDDTLVERTPGQHVAELAPDGTGAAALETQLQALSLTARAHQTLERARMLLESSADRLDRSAAAIRSSGRPRVWPLPPVGEASPSRESGP